MPPLIQQFKFKISNFCVSYFLTLALSLNVSVVRENHKYFLKVQINNDVRHIYVSIARQFALVLLQTFRKHKLMLSRPLDASFVCFTNIKFTFMYGKINRHWVLSWRTLLEFANINWLRL